jgi:NAD-dependent DNA ligase
VKKSVQDQLKYWSELYYSGEPEITNEEYDAVERIHGQTIQGLGDIPHVYRMFSLKKHYDRDGNAPISDGLVETLKLDGAAVALTYVNGSLVRALTRGDGIYGTDITKNASLLPGVLLSIESNLAVEQVTGEVVALSTVENSRNYASGALKQLNVDTFIQRKTDGDMRFIAYNTQNKTGLWGVEDTYTKDLERLTSLGFQVVTPDLADKYPTDGTVFRVDNTRVFNNMGFTDKFPRGAYAHKEEQEFVTTKLIAVEWNTGKSGKVTPVALLEPVIIGEATVSRATLNNIEYIEALELEIGCTVKLIRAGEIIPRIVGKC